MSHIHIIALGSDVRTAAEIALQNLDVYISSYASATAIESSISHGEVDVLIIDQKVEEGGGMGLMRDLKVKFPHLPMFFLMHEDDRTTRQDAMYNGARDILHVPFNVADVERKIMSVLR